MMMAAQFFTGASLLALLILDVCCLPVKKGWNPSASHGAPHAGSPQGAPNYASSEGGSAPAYLPVEEPGYAEPAVESRPAAPAGPGFASSGYNGGPVSPNPAFFAHSGPALQPGPPEVSWFVEAPGALSGNPDLSAGTRRAAPSGPQNVSPPYPPPGPVYQGGELSQYEGSFEHGNSERETEEQSYLPPPPPPMYVPAQPQFTSEHEPQFTSEPRPQPGGPWGYYDYRFLFGQYPPGTVSRFSSSFEQGRDRWRDDHYVKEFYPQAPVQQEQVFPDVSSPVKAQPPVKTPVQQSSSHGGFRAPASFNAPSRGSGVSKGGY